MVVGSVVGSVVEHWLHKPGSWPAAADHLTFLGGEGVVMISVCFLFNKYVQDITVIFRLVIIVVRVSITSRFMAKTLSL